MRLAQSSGKVLMIASPKAWCEVQNVVQQGKVVMVTCREGVMIIKHDDPAVFDIQFKEPELFDV